MLVDRNNNNNTNKNHTDLDQLLETFPVVSAANLLAERPVQRLADGPRQRGGEHHHGLRDVDRFGADGQPVTRAYGLRGDLAENYDGQRGRDDGHQAGRQVVQQDGEYGVDHDVAQQDAAQQVVAVDAHGQYGFGVLALRVRAGVADDLQVHSVQRHQAQVETGEERRERQAREDDGQLQPERQHFLVHADLSVILAAHVCPDGARHVALFGTEIERRARLAR